ncbi:MAG TPA: thioredoxin domain-containing protein [Polyangia bacterium]|jgi:thioredoxin-like negative regulator of GroEL
MGLLAKIFGPREPRLMPVSIDDENFEREVWRSEIPVLLDVWGPDCAPCKQLESVVITLANRYRGRVKVAELNAAAYPKVARRLRVSGTPTVVYFRGRTEALRVVGFRGERYHDEIIRTELLGEAVESEAETA